MQALHSESAGVPTIIPPSKSRFVYTRLVLGWDGNVLDSEGYSYSGPSALASAFEKHYDTSYVMELWGWGRDRVIETFADEPGVMVDGHEAIPAEGRRKRKRAYHNYSIPESAILRVHDRLVNKSIGHKTDTK